MGSPIGATFCTVTCVFGVEAHVQQAAAHGGLGLNMADAGALAHAEAVQRRWIHIAGLLTYISLRKLCFRALSYCRGPERVPEDGRRVCMSQEGKPDFYTQKGYQMRSQHALRGRWRIIWMMICRQAAGASICPRAS